MIKQVVGEESSPGKQVAIVCSSMCIYGQIRIADKDRNRDALDNLIASHVVALGVVLVTNNAANFVNHPGLVVENWVNGH